MSPFDPSPSASEPDRPTSLADAQQLAQSLRRPQAYPSCPATARIAVHETHCSWVFLAGDSAYKVKKPITTGFLDYGTLAKRKHYCEQELRLNQRYAPDLYLEVVPITREENRVCVEGSGEPIEFAVKMKRFPEDALLSEQLKDGKVTLDEVVRIAFAVASFHHAASPSDPGQRWGDPEVILNEALDNYRDLRSILLPDSPAATAEPQLRRLESWTEQTYQNHRSLLQHRKDGGFIRECHGDLHLANVVRWRGRWTPFDGIEFNDEFRWIDVLSDAAFLVMDFAAQGHIELGRSFINAYLEQTGDYEAVPVLRWYLVYRAMVRAKVAAIRWQQPGQSRGAREDELRDCTAHIDLASRFAEPTSPRLWITHGVSGSGKTFGSEYLIQQQGAIRLRSDVERKRLFGLAPAERPEGAMKQQLYRSSASDRTYEKLEALAGMLLRSGESVVVDATFLRRRYRAAFQRLAAQQGVPFAIVPFSAERTELERRVVERMKRDRDASDANLEVLHSQLEKIEALTEEEHQLVEIPPGATDRNETSDRRVDLDED